MFDDSEEALWIVDAKGGDLDAFESLYRLHVRQVYGVCRRLLDNTEDAEDMTQRVFLRAWKRLRSFRGEGGFRSWLRQIAVHLVIDERRSTWRQQLESMSEEGTQQPANPANTPGTAMDLERAIRLLPPGSRRVLVLHDVEGYTHMEIAELLGVTAGTTKTQLFRARRTLKEFLR